jgi:hypothetical protein
MLPSVIVFSAIHSSWTGWPPGGTPHRAGCPRFRGPLSCRAPQKLSHEPAYIKRYSVSCGTGLPPSFVAVVETPGHAL